MSADGYLQHILYREAVDTGPYSSVRSVQATLQPTIKQWANTYFLSMNPSGSFAKGTANKSGTDIDLFISLSNSVPETLKETYESLFKTVTARGYTAKRQNVSINVQAGGYRVDLVPAKRHDNFSDDHSLYRRRADTWTKTNVAKHINHVIQSGRASEIRIAKLWRDQKALDFPSFYLELAVINALSGTHGPLSNNVLAVFKYLRDSFSTARILDPANTNNVVSDDLSVAERNKVKAAAAQSLQAENWSHIVR